MNTTMSPMVVCILHRQNLKVDGTHKATGSSHFVFQGFKRRDHVGVAGSSAKQQRF
jgi:hypothetical protein